MSTPHQEIAAMASLGVVVTAYATDFGQTVVQIDTSTDDAWVNPDGSPGKLAVMLNDAKLYESMTLEAAFHGDALALLIAQTLTDRGMSVADAIDAISADPPTWDSFARRYVDPYEVSA